jgi:hypothetical protein
MVIERMLLARSNPFPVEVALNDKPGNPSESLPVGWPKTGVGSDEVGIERRVVFSWISV